MSTGAGGRPRIQQMADDLGISYKEAKALMAESRENVSPAVARVLKGFNREGADRIAHEDTKMVLKRKDGGSTPSANPAKRPLRSTPSPEMPAEGLAKARLRNKMRQQGMDDNQIDTIFKNPSLMGKEHPMNKENNRLKRRGDDEKVIEAKDGKYMSHGSSCGCMECSGNTVRGMGRAYQGATRSVKIR